MFVSRFAGDNASQHAIEGILPKDHNYYSVIGYHAVLDNNGGRFTLTEKVLLKHEASKKLVSQSFKGEVFYKRIGVMLREARFRPLYGVTRDSKRTGFYAFYRNRKKEYIQRHINCGAKIDVMHIPSGAFYKAKDPLEEVKVRSSYIDLDNASWSSEDANNIVVFSYVPEPYRRLRVIINPILELSSFSGWTMTALSFLVPLVLADVLKPLVVDNLKKRLEGKNKDDEKEGKEPDRKQGEEEGKDTE